MSKKAVLIAALLLALVAFLHMMRLFFPSAIIIGSLSIPIWASALVYLATGIICAYLFRAYRKL